MRYLRGRVTIWIYINVCVVPTLMMICVHHHLHSQAVNHGCAVLNQWCIGLIDRFLALVRNCEIHHISVFASAYMLLNASNCNVKLHHILMLSTLCYIPNAFTLCVVYCLSELGAITLTSNHIIWVNLTCVTWPKGMFADEIGTLPVSQWCGFPASRSQSDAVSLQFIADSCADACPASHTQWVTRNHMISITYPSVWWLTSCICLMHCWACFCNS